MNNLNGNRTLGVNNDLESRQVHICRVSRFMSVATVEITRLLSFQTSMAAVAFKICTSTFLEVVTVGLEATVEIAYQAATCLRIAENSHSQQCARPTAASYQVKWHSMPHDCICSRSQDKLTSVVCLLV